MYRRKTRTEDLGLGPPKTGTAKTKTKKTETSKTESPKIRT